MYLIEEAEANEDYSDLAVKLRTSLQNLEYSQFQYVLVANSVPPDLRDVKDLDFLMDITWSAVFDMDTASKSDGLYSVMKRVTESPVTESPVDVEESEQMERISQSCYKVVDASSWKQLELSSGTNQYAKTYQQTWIFGCGSSGGPIAVNTYDEWVRVYKTPVEDIIRLFFETPKMPIFVFLLLSSAALKQIVDLVKAILGQRSGQNSLVVLSKDRKLANQLCEMSQLDIRECCISGLPWAHVNDNIKAMTGGMDLISGKTVTSSSGTIMSVPAKKMREWTDIEVVGYNECESIQQDDEATLEARTEFYKGGQAQWLNFRHSHDVDRDVEGRLKDNIKRQIRTLNAVDTAKQPYRTRREHGLRFRIVVLQHEPGTGGTTVCRQMLWKFTGVLSLNL